MRTFLVFLAAAATAVAVGGAAAGATPGGATLETSAKGALKRVATRAAVYQRGNAPTSRTASATASTPVARNFQVVGHHDLDMQDENGDVWVHGDFAYVGTWADPCTGNGVKIVDISDPANPELVGRVARREGTSAEDVVVRSVDTPSFTGDLLATGIQRCFTAEDPALDEQTFGVELWSVTDPRNPYRLGVFPAATGSGGVHELDLFQRGDHVYALLATPWTEWFDPSHAGDFRILDVTNPRAPVQLAAWGAGAHRLSPGPFYGIGTFGSRFAHSARASANGMRAYVSYWDLGTLTFDISDPRNPVLVSRTQRYPRTSDGDAHSVSEYRAGGRHFLLQNNEDFDPRSPATIYLGAVPRSKNFVATESPGGAPLWLEPRHRISDGVVRAANEGCEAGDYPARADGRIVVVRTPFHEFDPGGGEGPECEQAQQEEMAEAAGAVAVIHDFISSATSPQWWGEPGDVDIPVLFVRHRAANAIVADGFVTLRGRWPGWGVLAIYNAETGRRIVIFDRAPNVHRLPPPPGDWSIHNSEVAGDRAYMSWYTNGIIAANLRPLLAGDEPTNVGQWVPPGAPSRSEFVYSGVAEVWGVAIRRSDNLILASDMNSGLWILRATGPAAP